MKDDVLFDCEKPLRTNKARLRKLPAFEIAAGERNRESVGMRATRDLAENQIFTWEIGDHQCGSALSDGRIVPRKRNDNDFASYRFDHAASSSGEFQSRARTDSLSSAPLKALSSSGSFETSLLTLRESEISWPTLRIFSSNVRSASSWRNSDFICLATSNYNAPECRPAAPCRSSPDQAFAQCARNLCADQRSQRWQ